MASIARIPINNSFLGNDYTGRIHVGPERKPMNVLLDTGSSALALDVNKYKPHLTGGDRTTDLAQTDIYADDSSWTGAVIKTDISIGEGSSTIVLPSGNAAIAYKSTSDMFSLCDG